MINYELLKDVLTMAILNSLIITSLVQRIKESVVIKCSRICIIVSFITSLIIGTLFSLHILPIHLYHHNLKQY